MRSGLLVAALLTTSVLTACSGAPPLSTALAKQPAQPAANGSGPEDSIVTLDYSGTINGYRVRVYWQPLKVKYSQVIGPAILEFFNLKDSTSFTLTDNYFSVPKNALNFTYNTDSTALKGIRERSLKMPYKDVVVGGRFASISEPFIFADIDFDQHKELLLKEADQGQRGVATFSAHKFDDGYNAPEPSAMKAAPFNSLDELSMIDYANKSIIIENSGGACASAQDTYKLRVASNEKDAPRLVLDRITEGQVDGATSKCYEVKYQVVNGQKRLLSKKEVKS